MKSARTNNLYTVFLSIIPVISVYRMPGMAISLATVLTAVAMIYSVMILTKRKIQVPFVILFPFMTYILYIMAKSNITFALLCLALFINILAISTNLVNERLLRRIIETVSVIAAISVVAQQVIHISTGVHIPLFIGNLFIGELKEQYSVALTTAVIDGLYRPSAFFLEPSHFAQYCIIGLGSCLFSEQSNIMKALLISFGVFATTSGMGFVVIIAMWGWWYLIRNKVSIGKIISMLCVSVVFLFILSHISFAQSIIGRITADPDSGDYNAIYGRLWWWDTYFGDFSFSTFMSGFGLDNQPEDAYFTGFMKQLFCYGIIGTSLLLIFLLQLLFKSNNLGKACIAIYVLLFFFADLTGYVSLLFYAGTFIVFYLAGNEKRIYKHSLKRIS